jgi:hypothetical protein
MLRLLRPAALLAAALPLHYHCTPAPTLKEKRTMIAEVRRERDLKGEERDLKGEEFPTLRLAMMVIKRYYLGIMRASVKAWLSFFIEYKLYILSVLFLLLA